MSLRGVVEKLEETPSSQERAFWREALGAAEIRSEPTATDAYDLNLLTIDFTIIVRFSIAVAIVNALLLLVCDQQLMLSISREHKTTALKFELKKSSHLSFFSHRNPHSFKLANSAAATRRLQFLLRCLGGYAGEAKNCGYQNTIRMQSVVSIGAGLEVDAVSVLRSITPNLDSTKHKGQAGKIAVVGGCREYTGAPYFSAISALKIGADLSHVFCTKDAAPVIKSYSPELIVHPILEESYSIRDEDKSSISAKVIAEVDKWMERFDCLVIGPGLGRDPFLLDCVSNIIKHARDCDVPMVIDGDGLFLVTNCLDLVRGYPLAVLTPNINEYKRLVQSVLNSEVNDENGTEQLKSLVNGIGGVTILRKGKSDLISDGKTVSSVSIYGSPRRCGGQGDILSGSVAVFLCWARQQAAAKGESVTNPTILGCIAGSVLLRNAAALAFKNKRRSTLTGDIIECLGQSLEEICPVL
nr:ATP-dependent (S)-NAD(P)H-hydrate dehydratase-like [Ipomoea trifida]